MKFTMASINKIGLGTGKYLICVAYQQHSKNTYQLNSYYDLVIITYILKGFCCLLTTIQFCKIFLTE